MITTIYPLYDFASRVGGERVEVSNLLPAGVEPHTWEPNPRQMAGIFDARVFVFNGAGLEPWVKKQLPLLEEKGVRVVEASKGLDLIRTEEHEHPSSPGGGIDPHVWLDPVMAQQIVNKIKDAFIAVDPEGKEYYNRQAGAYCQELNNLDREYQEALAKCSKKEFVVSHEAFNYLARRYGLRQVGIMGLSPASEPDPAHLTQVIKFCREHDVKYIFFETMVSPRLSETIAQEVGARTLVLNPVGNLTPEQQAKGENYLSIMRQNLDNLKVALEGK